MDFNNLQISYILFSTGLIFNKKTNTIITYILILIDDN